MSPPPLFLSILRLCLPTVLEQKYHLTQIPDLADPRTHKSIKLHSQIGQNTDTLYGMLIFSQTRHTVGDSRSIQAHSETKESLYNVCSHQYSDPVCGTTYSPNIQCRPDSRPIERAHYCLAIIMSCTCYKDFHLAFPRASVFDVDIIPTMPALSQNCHCYYHHPLNSTEGQA